MTYPGQHPPCPDPPNTGPMQPRPDLCSLTTCPHRHRGLRPWRNSCHPPRAAHDRHTPQRPQADLPHPTRDHRHLRSSSSTSRPRRPCWTASLTWQQPRAAAPPPPPAARAHTLKNTPLRWMPSVAHVCWHWRAVALGHLLGDCHVAPQARLGAAPAHAVQVCADPDRAGRPGPVRGEHAAGFLGAARVFVGGVVVVRAWRRRRAARIRRRPRRVRVQHPPLGPRPRDGRTAPRGPLPPRRPTSPRHTPRHPCAPPAQHLPP